MNVQETLIMYTLSESNDEWAGGMLQDEEQMYGESLPPTPILKITFENNYFKVIGKDYTCGFDTNYGGIEDLIDRNAIRFFNYGTSFTITKNKG